MCFFLEGVSQLHYNSRVSAFIRVYLCNPWSVFIAGSRFEPTADYAAGPAAPKVALECGASAPLSDCVPRRAAWLLAGIREGRCAEAPHCKGTCHTNPRHPRPSRERVLEPCPTSPAPRETSAEAMKKIHCGPSVTLNA